MSALHIFGVLFYTVWKGIFFLSYSLPLVFFFPVSFFVITYSPRHSLACIRSVPRFLFVTHALFMSLLMRDSRSFSYNSIHRKKKTEFPPHGCVPLPASQVAGNLVTTSLSFPELQRWIMSRIVCAQIDDVTVNTTFAHLDIKCLRVIFFPLWYGTMVFKLQPANPNQIIKFEVENLRCSALGNRADRQPDNACDLLIKHSEKTVWMRKHSHTF